MELFERVLGNLDGRLAPRRWLNERDESRRPLRPSVRVGHEHVFGPVDLGRSKGVSAVTHVPPGTKNLVRRGR